MPKLAPYCGSIQRLCFESLVLLEFLFLFRLCKLSFGLSTEEPSCKCISNCRSVFMGFACRSWWLSLFKQFSLHDTHHLMSDWYHPRRETFPEELAGWRSTIGTGRACNIESAAPERCHWLVRSWQLKIRSILKHADPLHLSTRLRQRNAIGPRLTLLPTFPPNVVLERL